MHRLLRQLRLQVTSTPHPQRAVPRAGPFSLHPTAPILARLPMLPIHGGAVEDLLEEGVFLASRRLVRRNRPPTGHARACEPTNCEPAGVQRPRGPSPESPWLK